MRVTNKPENTDQTNAAHPSLGKSPEDKIDLGQIIFTTKEIISYIEGGTKGAAKDIEAADNANKRAFHCGEITAYSTMKGFLILEAERKSKDDKTTPLHATAPELLKAVETLTEYAERNGAICLQFRELIKKAKGI